MRKNRKVSKRMSAITGHAMQMGAVMMMLFVMAIVNLLASSSCKQLEDSVGKKERYLASLNNDYDREKAHWEATKSSERLEYALIKHGLTAMKYPETKCVVRMRADGTPYPGQQALAALDAGRSSASTARNGVQKRR